MTSNIVLNRCERAAADLRAAITVWDKVFRESNSTKQWEVEVRVGPWSFSRAVVGETGDGKLLVSMVRNLRGKQLYSNALTSPGLVSEDAERIIQDLRDTSGVKEASVEAIGSLANGLLVIGVPADEILRAVAEAVAEDVLRR